MRNNIHQTMVLQVTAAILVASILIYQDWVVVQQQMALGVISIYSKHTLTQVGAYPKLLLHGFRIYQVTFMSLLIPSKIAHSWSCGLI